MLKNKNNQTSEFQFFLSKRQTWSDFNLLESVFKGCTVTLIDRHNKCMVFNGESLSRTVSEKNVSKAGKI